MANVWKSKDFFDEKTNRVESFEYKNDCWFLYKWDSEVFCNYYDHTEKLTVSRNCKNCPYGMNGGGR